MYQYRVIQTRNWKVVIHMPWIVGICNAWKLVKGRKFQYLEILSSPHWRACSNLQAHAVTKWRSSEAGKNPLGEMPRHSISRCKKTRPQISPHKWMNDRPPLRWHEGKTTHAPDFAHQPASKYSLPHITIVWAVEPRVSIALLLLQLGPSSGIYAQAPPERSLDGRWAMQELIPRGLNIWGALFTALFTIQMCLVGCWWRQIKVFGLDREIGQKSSRIGSIWKTWPLVRPKVRSEYSGSSHMLDQARERYPRRSLPRISVSGNFDWKDAGQPHWGAKEIE